MYDSVIISYLLKVTFHLGFLLASEKLFFLLFRILLHRVLRISVRSIPINVFIFILRALICSYIFMLAASVVMSLPKNEFVIAAWAAYASILFFYTVSAVMPMREAWSYTQDGPLMSRAYVDVFHPWITFIIFGLMTWFVDAKSAINETIIRIPSNLCGRSFESLIQVKSFADNFDLEQFSLAIITAFGLFLAFHYIRGLYFSWDYFANLFEVLRGETPSDEIVEAVAQTEEGDAQPKSDDGGSSEVAKE